jgi:hypothetical protein
MSIQEKYLAGRTVFEVKDAISLLLAESQPSDDPTLIEEGYGSFNIMLFGGAYYGLPQSEGAFEPQKAEKNEYESCFSSKSIAEVKKAIDAFLRKRTSAIETTNWEPRKIEEGYRGFNLFRFGDSYYGLPGELGAFSVESFYRREYADCCQAGSAEELRAAIDEFTAVSNRSMCPVLIEEGYRGHNIVLFCDKYYAVPQDGKAFDASKI